MCCAPRRLPRAEALRSGALLAEMCGSPGVPTMQYFWICVLLTLAQAQTRAALAADVTLQPLASITNDRTCKRSGEIPVPTSRRITTVAVPPRAALSPLELYVA